MTPTLTILICLGLSLGQRTPGQTGTFLKPSIWAEPGSVITWGMPVTIWCQGTLEAEEYRVDKEGVPELWDRQNLLEPRDKAKFFISSMRDDYAGQYRCSYHSSRGWSEPSESLELVVTGVSRKPSLLAQPCPIVASGQNLTLQCHSDISYDRFALFKEGGRGLTQRLGWQPQAGLSQADFPLVRVSRNHGGRYRCYGGYNDSSKWSAPSEPMDILIAGELPATPSLSAELGPKMSLGENVTLQCHSGTWFDTFLLSKEGGADSPLHLRSINQAHLYLANFTVSPVTLANGVTYRCYGSRSTTPYLLSQPSAPLELMVSGEEPPPMSLLHANGASGSPSSQPSWQNSIYGLTRYMNILIGISLASDLLIFFFLFLLIQQQCKGKCRKAGAAGPEAKTRDLQKRSSSTADLQEEHQYAAMGDCKPEEDRQLDSQSPKDEETLRAAYAQVNKSRLGQGVADSLSLNSIELRDMKERQVEEDSQKDSQAAAPAEEHQNMTYTQRNNLTHGEEMFTPSSSQSGQPPAEPSL